MELAYLAFRNVAPFGRGKLRAERDQKSPATVGNQRIEVPVIEIKTGNVGRASYAGDERMRRELLLSGERSRKMEELVGPCGKAPFRACKSAERHEAASGLCHAFPDQEIPFCSLDEPFRIKFALCNDLSQGVERVWDFIAFDPVKIPRDDIFHGAEFSKSKTQAVVRASSNISEQLEK